MVKTAIVSKAGSGLIKEQVFDEILKSESELQKKEDRQQVDITPRNYNFSFVDRRTAMAGPAFGSVFLRNEKISIRCWAMPGLMRKIMQSSRIHGVPAKKPFVWTLKN